MGVTSSKFRQALQRGEEAEAVDLYMRNPNLKKAPKLNRSFGSNHGHNTALHYVTTHGMKDLLRDLLSEGANPFVKNANGQTAFHCVCVAKNGDDKRRLECLNLLISWMNGNEGLEESIRHAIDKEKNSPLHYAANSGLLDCVKVLVSSGAPLYLENENGQTACDIAMTRNFKEIAEFLESKMVFSETPEPDDETIQVPPEGDKEQCGLGTKQIQETKDQLLVQTADMLQISLFMAEGLLRYFEWSRESLLDAWMQDPIAACEKAGVTQSQESEDNVDHGETKESENEDCKICCEVFNAEKSSLAVPCGHTFCTQCWESYLSYKIIDGDIDNIKCPSFGCSCLVPVEVIESVVPKDIAKKYGVFNIKAFVDSNPNLKWCPFPECGNAVRLPETQTRKQCSGAEAVTETSPLIVDCGHEHYFCWNCMEEAHEPSTCEGWQRWLDVIKDMLPKFPKKDLKECPETERIANSLWLISNSKPCPKCISPIQKNEGCNHIKCAKCKHEFCWVCLEPWKKHNSSTGGYFRCNRYEVVKVVQEKVEEKTQNITEEHERVEKLNHFLHYYSRFKNHENSYKLEEPLLKSAKDKMVGLAIAAESAQCSSSLLPSSSSQPDTSFVEDVIKKLLKARRVLRASYGYGFFLGRNEQKQIIFESMQTELEEATEHLSQMVARPYLRTPRTRIINAAQLTHRKKDDFLIALSRGLLPPDNVRHNYPKRYDIIGLEDSDDEFFLEEEPTLKLQKLIETSLKLSQEAGSSLAEVGHHRRPRPEDTRPERTRPERTRPERTRPERTRPEHTRPESTRPERTRPKSYSSDEDDEQEDCRDNDRRRVGQRRIIVTQETADLQKAIELSYKDMMSSSTKGVQSDASDNDEDIDLKMAIELFMNRAKH